jgi:hypothetical protein
LREKTRKLMNDHAGPLPAEIIKELDLLEKKWHKESRSKHQIQNTKHQGMNNCGTKSQP